MPAMTQYITRQHAIDFGHRVMDERFKCFNLHGHRGLIEMTFGFKQCEDIGYAVNFKEIKRVACAWLDEHLDHGFAANPHDHEVIQTCQGLGSKLYPMSLNGEGQYCNPTAENLGKELFLAIHTLFIDRAFWLESLRFYETPNCWVDTDASSINEREREHFLAFRGEALRAYAKEKGIVEYDQRKL